MLLFNKQVQEDHFVRQNVELFCCDSPTSFNGVGWGGGELCLIERGWGTITKSDIRKTDRVNSNDISQAGKERFFCTRLVM